MTVSTVSNNLYGPKYIEDGHYTYLVYTDKAGVAHLERRCVGDDGTVHGDEYVISEGAAHDIGVAFIELATRS